MEWVRANFLYERLKGRARLTALQERLCFIVFLKRENQRYLEMELLAFTGITNDNQATMMRLLDRYRQELFPGSGKPQDEFMEAAKQRLAEEVKNVYIVKPLRNQDRTEQLQKAALSPNPVLRKWGSETLRKEQRISRAATSYRSVGTSLDI